MWRFVPGHAAYAVSSDGRIRRLWGGRGARAGRILRPYHGAGGYLQVTLCGSGRPQKRYVHEVVASVFLGLPPAGLQVNHRNGRKDDPRLENLEYVTPGGNNEHAYRLGLRAPNGGLGERHPLSKLNAEQVSAIRAADNSISALSRRYGVSRMVIRGIRARRYWKHVT